MTTSQPTEQQYQAALHQTFDNAKHLMAASSDGKLWPRPQRGSRMEADDQETQPHQLSHFTQGLINSAIEHFHATAELIRRDDGLHIHSSPPFTLCRTAVETAANAYWLLSPKDQQTRLRRHATCVQQDTADYEQVTKIVNERSKQPHDPKVFDERRKWAADFKAKHDLKAVPGSLSTTGMIKDVDAAIAQDEGRHNDRHMEIYWRTASGFIHGRQWAALNVLVKDQVVPLGDSTATVKLTSTPSRVLWGTGAASEMIDRSLALYYEACGYDPSTGKPVDQAP